MWPRVVLDAGSSFGWFGVGVLAAQVNIGLGLLNLLPFHPFDGGHVVAAGVNRALRCRKARRPVLCGMAAMSVPALAAPIVVVLATSAIDGRVLV